MEYDVLRLAVIAPIKCFYWFISTERLEHLLGLNKAEVEQDVVIY